MPLLDLAQLEGLRKRPPRECENCRRAVNPNYCRQCDAFFEAGHHPASPVVSCADQARHDDHRTY